MFANSSCSFPSPPFWFFFLMAVLGCCGFSACLLVKYWGDVFDWYHEKRRLRAEWQMQEEEARTKVSAP